MDSVQAFRCQWLSDMEMPLANKFYRNYGFRGKAKRHDPCAVVRAQCGKSREHGEIIACAYLRQYQNVQLLAGVAVAPAYQGQGVARLLLEMMVASFAGDSHTVVTFPYLPLIDFYRSLGFIELAPETQDSVVQDLFNTYRRQGRDIALMGHNPADN